MCAKYRTPSAEEKVYSMNLLLHIDPDGVHCSKVQVKMFALHPHKIFPSLGKKQNANALGLCTDFGQ